jgi:hypothetical protein
MVEKSEYRIMKLKEVEREVFRAEMMKEME